MLVALLELLPVGIATAISTVPLLASISILLSPGRAALAWPFLVGFCGGMLVLTALFAVGLTLAPPTPYTTPEAFMGAEIVLGILVALVAVAMFTRRNRPRLRSRPNVLAGQLQRLRPWSAMGFGLLLNVRPKALILAAAAGVIIGGVSRVFTGGLVLVLVSVAIGASSVAVPIIVTQARPALMEPRLQASQAWIVKRQGVVTSVVLFAVGVFLILNGVFRSAQ